MWVAQFLTFNEPNTIISSGGSGTMGFGLPAAIGAQIGKPEKSNSHCRGWWISNDLSRTNANKTIQATIKNNNSEQFLFRNGKTMAGTI